MAKNWRRHTVYPPRYFAGFVTLASGVKIEFFNAPIIPVSKSRAYIFTGAPGHAFYDKPDARIRRLDADRDALREIQYAISVFDPEKSGYRIEKFNHPFDTDTRIGWDNTLKALVIATADGGDLYGSYKVNQVLDDVSRCDVPVTQFIS